MTALSSFIERFQLWIDKTKCTVDAVCLRSAISSEEEALEFVKSFSAITGSDWVIHHGRPHFPKYAFVKTWVCHRSWNTKSESSDAKCSARIQILLKKINPSANKIDVFLSHNPPLYCIIRLIGKHCHTSVEDDSFQMVGLTSELKDKFYEYFQIGLTATEARTQHDIAIHTLKNEKKNLKHSSNLTIRQAQRLYNHWEIVKDTMGVSKENNNSPTTKFTIEELLKAMPIKLPQSSKESTVELNRKFFSGDNSIQFPLTFVCAYSTGTSAGGNLLYNLKYGPQQTFVSRLTVPSIPVVRIGSLQNSFDKELSNIEDVSIKLEPIDYDEEIDDPMYPCSENVHDTPTTPIISKADNAPSLNSYSANDVLDDESCVFPLVFTSTGITSPSSNYDRDAPILYSLKYGPHGLHATSLSTPYLLGVHVPSTNKTTLNIKNDSSKSEVTFDSHIQVEHIKTEVEDIIIPLNPQIVTSAESMPHILDVSSCKKRKKRKKSSKTYLSNRLIAPKILPTKYRVASTIRPSEPKADEDYHFLMSLLPHLKQMPQDQKKLVKKKIQEIVITSRITASKVKFDHLRSNVYRDCGVLPSLDWKF